MLGFTPNIDTVKVPINIVRIINDKDYGIERGEVLPASLEELVKFAIKNLDSISAPSVLDDLDPEETKRVLKLLKPLLTEYFKATSELNDIVENSQSESTDLIQQLVNKINNLITELIFISNNRTIDETSNLYSDFLVSLMNKSISTGERLFGKKKLLGLFD